MVYVVGIAATVLSKYAIKTFWKENYENILVRYISPTIVIASVALVVLFLSLHIGNELVKIIRLLSPCALGVYLIHVNPYIWQEKMKNCGKDINVENPVAMFAGVLLLTGWIFVLCLSLEFVRVKLFEALRIPQRLKKLDNF